MWRELFGILLCISVFLTVSSLEIFDKDKLKISLRNGIDEYLKSGNKTEELQTALKSLQIPGIFRKDSRISPFISVPFCAGCDVVASVLLNVPREDVKNLLETLCIWLGVEPPDVCEGFFKVNAETIIYIVDNTHHLTSSKLCSIMFQFMGCKEFFRQDWTINIPESKSVKPSNVAKKDPANENPMKILHISDIHYDMDYTIGSNAACDEPMCCRPGTKPDNPKGAAGRWGDYRCDTSWEMLDSTLDHITSQHDDLSYIYFTGDIVDHKLWGTNVPRNIKAISSVLEKLKNSFGDTPLFPILGNHDPHPLNAYSPDAVNNKNISSQWIFKFVAEQWQMWLPPETKETILKGGYYTVLVKPGFRIVALNSAVCFFTNWWLIYDDYDPYGQLKWLVDVLLKAEENGEIVHIISHVPSGDFTCFKNWGKEYAKIIKRFSKTVVAQFNGHTHRQDVILYYKDSGFNHPVHIAFNGGSITTWYGVNPNYLLHRVDPSSYEVLDFESWTYNVSDANFKPNEKPKWYKLYSFKDAYNVPNLKPNTVNALVKRMTKNRTLAEKYFRFRFKNSEYSAEEGCNNRCHKENLCAMVTNYFEDENRCNTLKKTWDANND